MHQTLRLLQNTDFRYMAIPRQNRQMYNTLQFEPYVFYFPISSIIPFLFVKEYIVDYPIGPSIDATLFNIFGSETALYVVLCQPGKFTSENLS